MTTRRSRSSQTKATEQLEQRLFRTRMVSKSLALLRVKSCPGFLSVRNDTRRGQVSIPALGWTVQNCSFPQIVGEANGAVAEESAVTCFWARRAKSLRSWSGTELKKRPILEGANYGTQEIVLGRSPTPYSDAPSGTVPDVLIGTQLDPASLVEAAIGTSDLVAFGQRPESPSEATSKAGRPGAPGAPGAGVAIQLELNQAK
jgi:hypothetical protein